MSLARTSIEIRPDEKELVEIVTEDKGWMRYIEVKLNTQPSYNMPGCRAYHIQKSKLPELVSHFIKGKR